MAFHLYSSKGVTGLVQLIEVKQRLFRGYPSLMPSCESHFEPTGSRLGPFKSTFNVENLMCWLYWLSVVISTLFAPELCVAARNHQKVNKTRILVFRIIQGHCIQC